MPAEPGSAGDGWQALADQGLRAWSDAGAEVARTVAQNLLAGQSAMGRVIELTSSAWTAMAPPPQADGEWRAALDRYAEQVRQLVLGTPPPAPAAGDVAQLWQLYLRQVQELSQPWLHLMVRDAPAHLGRSRPDDHSELIELSNHYWDAYERTIGRLLGSPSLGYSRELNHRLAEGFAAWQQFLRAGFEYRVVMGDAWVRAFTRTMDRLREGGAGGEPVTSVKQLIAVWTDTADDAFTEVFQSARYVEAQARLLNSAMALRLKQQEIADDLLKGSNVPSRSEVDEAHRSIYELRKEVRDLRKQLAALRTASRRPPARARTASPRPPTRRRK